MRFWLSGWSLYQAEKKAHRATRLAHANTVEALQREERRAEQALRLATEPCIRCETTERERDEALLELDHSRSDYDDLRATLCWLEGKFFNGSTT